MRNPNIESLLTKLLGQAKTDALFSTLNMPAILEEWEDGVVTRALGHKRAETTRSHYTGFQTKHAIRQHDALVLARRANSLPHARGGSADGQPPPGQSSGLAAGRVAGG